MSLPLYLVFAQNGLKEHGELKRTKMKILYQTNSHNSILENKISFKLKVLNICFIIVVHSNSIKQKIIQKQVI